MPDALDKGAISKAAAVAVSGGTKTGLERWSSVVVPEQPTETAMDKAVADGKWSQIYALAGASGESERDGVYAAVLAYFTKNGTSPEGNYKHPVSMPNGKKLPAGEIVKITGKLDGEIRQFVRADLRKAYECVKNLPALKTDPYLLAEAERWGISGGRVYLLADFLSKCPFFVGDEDRVYESVRSSRISDAAERRAAAGRVPKPDSNATHIVESANQKVVPSGAQTNPLSPW